MLNAFIRIAPDNTVTVLSKHVEMGQGTYTGLSTIVAEELDADWKQIRAEGAQADAKLYASLAFGMQGTGGSTADRKSGVSGKGVSERVDSGGRRSHNKKITMKYTITQRKHE